LFIIPAASNFHPHHQRFYSQNLASRINETAFPDTKKCQGAAMLVLSPLHYMHRMTKKVIL
jgi:hypothetical protein